MKKEDEFLKCLLTLNRIFKNSPKDYDGIVHSEEFNICNYRFTLFFIYDSVTVNIKFGCNFRSYMIEFKNEKFGDEEKKIARIILSLPDLPPDMIINKLNQIGVKEL